MIHFNIVILVYRRVHEKVTNARMKLKLVVVAAHVNVQGRHPGPPAELVKFGAPIENVPKIMGI